MTQHVKLPVAGVGWPFYRGLLIYIAIMASFGFIGWLVWPF